LGRGLGWVTHRGPCRPLPCWGSGILWYSQCCRRGRLLCVRLAAGASKLLCKRALLQTITLTFSLRVLSSGRVTDSSRQRLFRGEPSSRAKPQRNSRSQALRGASGAGSRQEHTPLRLRSWAQDCSPTFPAAPRAGGTSALERLFLWI